MNDWIAAITFLVLSALVSGSLLLAARVFAVRAREDSPLKRQTYECGEEPEGEAWIKFHPRYYVTALVFVLFDVEAVFLFPWALNIREVGELAIWDMLIFVTILLLGWLYAVRKGGLKWQ